VVHRERDNIELLIEVPSFKLVVMIENKVGSSAGDGQLARYKELVECGHGSPSRRGLGTQRSAQTLSEKQGTPEEVWRDLWWWLTDPRMIHHAWRRVAASCRYSDLGPD
jgi:hypothetical protein